MRHPLKTPRRGPKRKIRGLRRYFAQIIKEAEDFSIDPKLDDWWDFWHYHSDWPGVGNISVRSRVEHLRALLTVMGKIHSVKDQFATQFQSWIILNCQDSSQDAVFLHTPNANGSIFPALYPEIEWGVKVLDPVLSKLAPDTLFQVGRASGTDTTEDPPVHWSSFFIYRPDLGVPLV